MAYKNVREFIDRLEKEGEVQRIEEEVDWNLEAGAMLRRSAEAGLPAPFFQKIEGYPEGYRLFGGGFARLSRLAMAMDLDPDTPFRDLIEVYLRRKRKPIKPVIVNNGPCKENINVGHEVDLFKFPVPMLHQGDGGRYIGTWHVTICKDFDSDWVNWSMQRHMVYNKNTCGILADPVTHLGDIYTRSYEPRNQPMEVAIAIGVEPISTLCATSPLPYGVSEVEMVGGIRGEPVELIKCETSDIAVPATAEIILEGEIRPHERMEEGPFGEWTGYMTGEKHTMPVIHIRAVTHRDNPILTMSCLGIPVDDNCILSLIKSAEFLEALRTRGLPITGVCVPPETSGFLAVVGVKTTYANIAETIAHVIWGTSHGRLTPYIVIVDDDVDPFNLPQWLHALVSKCHPYRGIVRLEHASLSPIIPFSDRHERLYRMGAKAYFDCTWPLDWDPQDVPRRSSFADIYPLKVQQKALAKWSKYGH